MAEGEVSGATFLARVREASCNICGGVGVFSDAVASVEEPPDDPGCSGLRESLVCSSCGSISRDRALAVGIGAILQETGPMRAWSANPGLRVFETSGYRAHPAEMERLFDYFNTRELPPENLPEQIDGRTVADLEDLPYPDGFFDLAVSAEVLEHVADLDAALGELRRVLSDDGRLVVTAPYMHEWERSLIRAYRWRGKDVLLYPPEYHAEDTLAYRTFGRDLLAQLARLGFAVAVLRGARADNAISAQEVIVATRAPYLDVSTLAFGEEANERL